MPDAYATDLTRQEMKVLWLIAQGLSSKEIARELGRSFCTIEIHAQVLQKKMHATTRAHAAAIAVGLGMVQIVEPLRTQND